MLTDGAVADSDKVIKLIRATCSPEVKVFSLGIGSGCSTSLVIRSAEAGKGTYNFATDSNLAQVVPDIIDSLQKASEPALLDCSLQFVKQTNDAFDKNTLFHPMALRKLGHLYRHHLVREYTIMSTA